MAKSSKTPKKSPAKSAKNKVGRAKRRLLDRLMRQSVAQEKADRSERHAGLRREVRAGIDRTRRASRR
ncbi:hypothetical protein ACIBH1_04995 [Nonomuraea sp. NPDC050663]|uniref:hypothetical protein n=1 Tax=Nonomuraea sp. NPDC050663 TaxID=3364370 RepID=UPI003799D7B0